MVIFGGEKWENTAFTQVKLYAVAVICNNAMRLCVLQTGAILVALVETKTGFDSTSAMSHKKDEVNWEKEIALATIQS